MTKDVLYRDGRIMAFRQIFCDGAQVPSAFDAREGVGGYVDFYDCPDTPADPASDTKLQPGGPWNVSAWRRHGCVEFRWKIAPR